MDPLRPAAGSPRWRRKARRDEHQSLGMANGRSPIRGAFISADFPAERKTGQANDAWTWLVNGCAGTTPQCVLLCIGVAPDVWSVIVEPPTGPVGVPFLFIL